MKMGLILNYNVGWMGICTRHAGSCKLPIQPSAKQPHFHLLCVQEILQLLVHIHVLVKWSVIFFKVATNASVPLGVPTTTDQEIGGDR